ncbi:Ubiquitin-like-conjugating enzyme ATG10 [Toxocara canis]|uniref:Ubiquitin-like-conjugating enzyme ATG10 n=1 Tax=Toxocara canis TaxID=6265 RepID=A0A0B2VSR1_TOXCA|nr:Ubiquitin-like-conjugating enzyme ATG10 [Toxocara canis]
MSGGVISEEEFERNIVELAQRSENCAEYRWSIAKYENGTLCKSSSMLEYKNEIVVRHFHITYSRSYGVPVLWFNFYTREGNALHLEDITEILRAEHNEAVEFEALKSISQGEHPVLGIMFYHIHPCKTHLVMRHVRYDNYVLSWLSIFGSALHLSLPGEMFVERDK